MSLEKLEHPKDIGEQAKQGILWTSLFNGIQFVIRFCGSIVLARILFPEDFGLMGIAYIVIHFARRLARFGFNMVLVQRKNIRNEHYETVFVLNFLLMSTLTAVLFFSAPYISEFFENEIIRPVITVMGFEFIIKALISVPSAILRRLMKFKMLETARTIGGIVAILSTVALAVAGCEVWSLVCGHLIGSLVEFILTAYYAQWIPRMRFYFWALKDVFVFGFWIYIDSYISLGIKKADFFIIGKLLGATQLGLYERAFYFMSIPRRQIVMKINRVLFSAYSRMQDDHERIVRSMLRIITYFSLFVYPLMAWMFFSAPSLITVLYGPKWLKSIYPLQIMCIAGIVETFTLVLGPVLLAEGLVGHRTCRRFIYLIVLVLSVLIGVRWGISGVAWGITLASFFQLILMLQLSMSNLPFSVWMFFKAQKSAICYTSIQVIALILFQQISKDWISNNSWQMLASSTFISGIVLFIAHLIFRYEDVQEISIEFYRELKKFAVNLPIIGRWSSSSTNS